MRPSRIWSQPDFLHLELPAAAKLVSPCPFSAFLRDVAFNWDNRNESTAPTLYPSGLYTNSIGTDSESSSPMETPLWLLQGEVIPLFSAHTTRCAWFCQMMPLASLTRGEAVADSKVLRVLTDPSVNSPAPPNLLIISYFFPFCNIRQKFAYFFPTSSSTNSPEHNHSHFSHQFSFLCFRSVISFFSLKFLPLCWVSANPKIK